MEGPSKSLVCVVEIARVVGRRRDADSGNETLRVARGTGKSWIELRVR